MYILSIFKKVLSILNNRQKRNFFFLIVLMLFAGILETLGISLFIPIVYVIIDDNVFNTNALLKGFCNMFNINTQKNFLVIAFLALGVVFILKNIFLHIQNIIKNKYVYNNRARFFDKVYSLYLNKDYYYYVENSSGNITRAVYYDVIYTFDVLLYVINIITECVISMIILMFLFVVNWKISIMAGVVLLIELVIIYKIIKPILVSCGKINITNSSNFLSNIIQSIESIKEIKVFNTEQYFINKNKNLVDSLSETEKFYKTLSLVPKLIIEAFTFGILSLILSVLVWIGMDIKMFIPSLSAFAVAAVKLLPSINKISSNLSNATYYMPNLDNIVALVHSDSFKEDILLKNKDDYKNKTKFVDFNDKIAIKNVSFKYDKSEKFIFDNLNLTLLPNKSVGIIGGSGEGKTTLVDLLTGLLKPTSGEIMCDGKNIKDNYSDWLSLIGYIPQNTTLINDTIRANVAFGVELNSIDEDKFINALKDAQIYDFVCGMEKGFDTTIGDRGIKLSGGQRQRIGIARALYKNPKILIFDEATSALDNETEREVMKSIDSLMNKKTIIIIAHRLSTIKNCDIIYKVENGKVVVDKSI